MQSILDVFQLPKEATEKSQRSQMIKEIYAFYTSEQERRFRKKENWKRYIQNCKDNRVPVSRITETGTIEKFKKNKSYIKELPVGMFAMRLGHLKTEKDLPYILSICRDRFSGNLPIGGWLFSAISIAKDKGVGA